MATASSVKPNHIDTYAGIGSFTKSLVKNTPSEKAYRENVFKRATRYLSSATYSSDSRFLVLTENNKYVFRTDYILNDSEIAVARYYHGRLVPFGSLMANQNFVERLRRKKERRQKRSVMSDGTASAIALEECVQDICNSSNDESLEFQGTVVKTSRLDDSRVFSTHDKPDACITLYPLEGDVFLLHISVKKPNFDTVENWVQGEKYCVITGDLNYEVLKTKLSQCASEMRYGREGTKKFGKKNHGLWRLDLVGFIRGMICDAIPLKDVISIEGSGGFTLNENVVKALGYAMHFRIEDRDGAILLDQLIQVDGDKYLAWTGTGAVKANFAYLGEDTLPENTQDVLNGLESIETFANKYELYAALQTVNEREKVEKRFLVVYYHYSVQTKGGVDFLCRQLIVDNPFAMTSHDVRTQLLKVISEYLVKK